MLIDIASDRPITRIPDRSDFDALRSGRYELDGKEIGSRTYFRLNPNHMDRS